MKYDLIFLLVLICNIYLVYCIKKNLVQIIVLIKELMIILDLLIIIVKNIIR